MVTRADGLPPVIKARRRQGLFVKVALMALVDALGVFLILSFAAKSQWAAVGIAVVVLILINVVYFSKRLLAGKYLMPGLVFLLVFQVFVVVYTVFVSFTNYGFGNNLDKDVAIQQILANSISRAPGSESYHVAVLEQNTTLYLLATSSDGNALLGSADQVLSPAPEATFTGGVATGVPGYSTLTFQQLIAQQAAVTSLAVPVTSQDSGQYLKTADGRTGYVYQSTLVYSSSADTMTDRFSGEVFVNDGNGSFVSADGESLKPGWKAFVGLSNYAFAFNSTGGTEIIAVFVWTFVFAVASTVLSFAAGTFMALVFNDPRMRARRVYRVVMILPYAFPLFLSGLVWSGLLNQKFGFINQVLLGGLEVPWLQRITVVLVSVWFGAPYFFLVCTGALQAIPDDVQEAARLDGASPWQIFRRIKLPLLLVAVSPLLIAGFAFSFNDFNTIFMLSGGGPANPTSPIGAGATDILITVVYKLAFLPGSKEYGLASAFSVIIFLIVSVMAIVLFRRSKELEDVY